MMAKGAAYGGLLVITTILLLFWEFTGHAPGYSSYEKVFIYSLTIVTIMIFLDYKYKFNIIGVYALPCIILALVRETTHVFTIDTGIPLFLTNVWFLPFVITSSIGNAVFAISLGISIMYLLAVKNEAQVTDSLFFSMPFPSSDILDNLLHKIIKIGFIFLTLSIITRTIYMTRIWGEPFDLYYVWPYVMWILYAILIMYRSARGQNANAAAWGSIACFFVSMHSFIGYNDFLRGL